MKASIDQLVDKLERQVKRYREMRRCRAASARAARRRAAPELRALFRRRRPLHPRLAEQAGLGSARRRRRSRGSPPTRRAGTASSGARPGIHGVPRPRRWDAVVPPTAPGLTGDAVRFAVARRRAARRRRRRAGDGARAARRRRRAVLGAAVPGRGGAEGGRLGGGRASRIQVVAQPDLRGDEAELVVRWTADPARRRPSRRSAARLRSSSARRGGETSCGPGGSSATSGRSRQRALESAARYPVPRCPRRSDRSRRPSASARDGA